MNISIKRKFAVISAAIATLVSVVGSASALTISRPEPSKGCTCMGRYYPAKICRVMRCVDSLNSFTTSDQRPLDSSLDKTLLSTVAASKNNLLAGRYRTRGPGGGI